MATQVYDVIIIGSGAAGLTAAINLAQDKRVLVLAKGAVNGGPTNWAQGGIAAVLDAGDTFESHVHDTMVAGAGLRIGRASCRARVRQNVSISVGAGTLNKER